MTATELVLPPAATLIAAGLLLPWLRGAPRAGVLLAAPLLALWTVWQVPDGPALAMSFLGHELVPVRGDALARLFGTAFAAIAFAGALFALNQPRTTELVAAFVYAGAALGVVFAGDLLSVFVGWELMAIASTVVVWCGGPGGRAAGLRYAAMHLLGGVLLMAGLAGEIAGGGPLAFGAMELSTPARWLILAGFLVNAAAVPLSAWLPDAYPEASWSGMVFLSAFTTKIAVYVLLRGFSGAEIVLWIGLATAFYGIVWALLENDMRRVVAYGIVGQVGIMLVGVGVGTPLASNGVAAHATASLAYTGLLAMSAGAVLRATGERRLDRLGGLFRTMPLTAACAGVAAASIAALPWTVGFVAKPMIASAVAEANLRWPWLLVEAAAAGTVIAGALVFPWFAFFGRDAGLRPPDPPWNMRAAMVLLAVGCVAIGVAPGPLYALLPYPVEYVPYTASHVLVQLQLLLFSGLAFFLMLGWLKRTTTIILDVDRLWRGPGARLGRWALEAATASWRAAADGAAAVGRNVVRGARRFHGPSGVFGRTWPTGTMAFWTTVMLGAYLVLSYLRS